MAINICVSTSEWVVVNKLGPKNEPNKLVTSGLFGCVAVAVESETQICLMHVLSSFLDGKTGDSENAKVRHDIELPLVVMGHRGGSKPRRFTLIYKGGTDKHRADAIQEHLLLKFNDLRPRGEHFLAPGVCVCNPSPEPEEYIQLPDTLPKDYAWKGCSGAMVGLTQSTSVCIETWGKIGSEWMGNSGED